MTPHEEDTNTLTPVDQRRRRRTGVFIFILLLIAVLVILAATVLAVNDGRNYRRLANRLGLQEYLLPPPNPVNMKVERPRRASLRDTFPPRLVSFSTEKPALLELANSFTAEQRCALIGSGGARKVEILHFNGSVECLMTHAFGEGPDAPSIFVQARMSEAGEFRSFRLKLNLTDERADTDLVRESVGIIERFNLPMTQETKAYLAEMITGRRPFTSHLDNYNLSFGPEMSDPRRFNLLITPVNFRAGCAIANQPESEPVQAISIHMPVACLTLESKSAKLD